MSNSNQAFTLVELIVVITILAILATIGFVSFSGYLAGTRDTNRIAQIKAMSDALELYTTKKDLPLPDDTVEIKAGTSTIAYQGYIGKNVLETIEYTEAGLDPKDKTYFSYYLTKNKKYFQLLTFLEEENTNIAAYTPNILTDLEATDYSERYQKVTGKKLGILIDENNTPIQGITTIQTSGLDLSDVGTTTSYKSIVADDEIITGSGTELSGTHSTASCKRIKLLKGSSSDGVYTIDPASDGTGFKVYCDMTTDGGGWTVIGHDREGEQDHDILSSSAETPGTFMYDVLYRDSSNNLLATSIINDLILKSEQSKQHLKKYCNGSVTYYGASYYAYWIGEDGIRGIWPNYEECDINDGNWRTSEGDITDKGKLPILKMYDGDMGGAGEKSMVTIGQLYIR